MNYRHSFHAGNFADVHKHVVLACIINHLCQKPAAFRVIDTHAGAGLYDLAAAESERTGEWRGGVGRVMAGQLSPDVEPILAPYRAALARYNEGSPRPRYPGSPMLALALMRPQDRLIASELEPGAASALSAVLRPDRRAKAVAIDGWTALQAYIPPKERRGLVLIDPPYERPDEFPRLVTALAAAHGKWPTGIYLAWYPIKDREGPDMLARAIRRQGVPKVLRSELLIRPSGSGGLIGSGLIIINPPFRLAEHLGAAGPALSRLLASPDPGNACLDWLSDT